MFAVKRKLKKKSKVMLSHMLKVSAYCSLFQLH